MMRSPPGSLLIPCVPFQIAVEVYKNCSFSSTTSLRLTHFRGMGDGVGLHELREIANIGHI